MNHKSEYEAIKKQIAECEQALKNRCIECSKHGFVPVEFIYQKNDCLDYDWLPF